ncbi:NAD-dependent epimerase/dehydratase family protein [Cryptosporangium aurantiacum]|uniref:Nucleoside-diphosphate-sugar epimerase n=1 Tax=Cryptosporangium aurantiacum TaxID=134849 RepID=A0A1M7R857_9ACTN|nr:NAD-dependent epimerase/dehydratase family protein [Cryptosporangium aurantiacum]SHN42507.1 Nucleoside-diphosphate-sugar epimerase [Cryptosporangium aurantiacum]
MTTQTRLLLLGADGFVGHHVRARLASEPGVTVITVARRGDVHADVQLDLTDGVVGVAHAVREVSPDTVVNCAGAASAPNTDPAAMAANNLVAVGNLVDALLTSGQPMRLVHVGSAAEYGRVPAGIAASEDTPERPVSTYGLSKLAATWLVRTAAAAGLDAVALRVTTPIGPEAPTTTIPGRVVAQLRQVEAEGAGVIATGPLDDVRDYVDVRDVADAVAMAALRPRGHGALPSVLNVGSGVATPVREMVNTLLTLAGYTGGLRTDGGGIHRDTAVPWQQCDVSAARSALGWAPTRSLETSLRDLWESSDALAVC